MERYTEYKDSGVEWIGDIPSHWGVEPLFARCSHAKEKNIDNESTVLSLSYGEIVIRDVERNFGLLPASFDTYQRIRPGDIILRLTDLQNDKRSLRVGYSHLNGIITSVYVTLRSGEHLLSNFLFYYLYDSDIRKVLYSLGGGLRQTLRFDELRRMPLICPSLTEQERIVAFLDERTGWIDEAVKKTEKKIALLKEQRASLINEVVTKGLDSNVEMTDSGVEWIGDIPSHWKMTKVGYQSALLSGFPWPSNNFSQDDGVRLLRGINAKEGYTKWGSLEERWPDEVEFNSPYWLQEGDIVIPMDGSKVGKNHAMINDSDLPALLHQRVCRIRSENTVTSRFQLYLVGSVMFHSYVDSKKTSHFVPHISEKDVADFRIPFPPVEEQERIVAFLDERTGMMDEVIAKEEERITLLKEYRQSLISEVVTGKRRVLEEPVGLN